MNTPRRKSRRKVSLVNEDITEIIYTQEEAEFLGYEIPKSYEDENEENEENDELDDFNDDLEEDEEEKEEKIIKPLIKKKKPTDKEKFYVNPVEFDNEIIEYYKTGNMSDSLAQMVSKIANKLSYAPNFINYTYREEMVGDGVIRMFKALTSKKYDHAKGSNPFSYFTRIAFNAFRNRIKKEKHLRDTHEKYQNELMLFSENYKTVVKNNQLRISQNNNY
jgi:hypothetical protein